MAEFKTTRSCEMPMCSHSAVTKRKFYPVLSADGRYFKLWVCQHHRDLKALSTVVSVRTDIKEPLKEKP